MPSLSLSKIRIDGGTQTRAKISNETVEEYADAVQAGDQFPEVTVYFDGCDYWLADGFHRYHGHRKAGVLDILADVRTGTLQDAVVFALKANSEHRGLKRTNDDKRNCVEIALKMFGDRSDRVIAEMCGVHHQMVSRARADVDDSSTSKPGTRIDSIGRRQPAKKTKPSAAAPAPDTSSITNHSAQTPPTASVFAPPPVEPSDAMVIAKRVVAMLSDIPVDDIHFQDAMKFVTDWCKHRKSQTK